jgi:predicted acetyltransferase
MGKKSIKILEYDQVDPQEILFLNLHSLDWPLTPERAKSIRRLDPRPFPFFGLYVVEKGAVAGQVLVYRLPVMSTEGPEELGGVAAVCTHHAHARRGVATTLLEEAHSRMRAAGMRFSTLGTSQYRAAYTFYRRIGYEDLFIPTATFSRYDDLQITTALRAYPVKLEELPLADDLYQRLSSGYLGFSRRHGAFLQMMVSISDLDLKEVWLIWQDNEPVGCALVRINDAVIEVNNLLLLPDFDEAEAVTAISRDLGVAYHWVRLDRPKQGICFTNAGYPQGTPTWSTFMVKPLTPDVSVDVARQLFQIGTDQFLISPIDVT